MKSPPSFFGVLPRWSMSTDRTASRGTRLQLEVTLQLPQPLSQLIARVIPFVDQAVELVHLGRPDEAELPITCRDLVGADVSPRRDHPVVARDLIKRDRATEARNIRVGCLRGVGPPGMVKPDDTGEVELVDGANGARDHPPSAMGIDEQNLAAPVTKSAPSGAVLRDEPQRHRDGGLVEQLGRQGDDAVDEAGFQNPPANVPFAVLPARQGAIREDEAGNAIWR